MTAAMEWLRNMRRMLLGRQRWSPSSEYEYYSVNSAVVQGHAAQRLLHVRDDYSAGRRMAESLGVAGDQAVFNRSVLEIGAGDGLLCESLLAHGKAGNVVALDAVPKQMWAAGAFKASERLRYVIGDAGDLPFEDGSFDLVVGHLVLHHIEPLQPVLREARRVLAPGGQFIAMEPTPIVGMLRHEKLSENEAPIRLRRLKREFAIAGFSAVQADYWWARFKTSALGPLSPNYRIRATSPGALVPARFSLSRSLRPMNLPGLEIDADCRFAALAEAQADQIRLLWPSASQVAGFPALCPGQSRAESLNSACT